MRVGYLIDKRENPKGVVPLRVFFEIIFSDIYMSDQKIKSLSTFIWSIAQTLRGDFKQSEYGKVVLPFVVMCRLDCVLRENKSKVLETANSLKGDIDDEVKDKILFEVAGTNFQAYNLSKFTFSTLLTQESTDIHSNLLDYITKFSPNVREIFIEKFLFIDQLKRLNEAGLLFQVFSKFVNLDLHPNNVSNLEMGYLFEELIRRFSEISNETAGEHYTPREVISLIVSLLLLNDKDLLQSSGIIRQVYDPAAGTGGMLSISEIEMKKFNDKIRVELFGQELNPESYAICKSDMLVSNHISENIAFGNSLTNDDAHKGKTFHYMLSNPPYGVKWEKYDNDIKEEHKEKGMEGRYGAGLPSVDDGQLLFLQHMISKMRTDENGSRIGIVMNGAPLYSGDASSGESEIRRWIIEEDWIEAIIALPTDLFYNTEIQTYIWLLSNRKSYERKNKIQLIDASNEDFWKNMKKSLGKKRKEIPPESNKRILDIFSSFDDQKNINKDYSKVFDKDEFGYRKIRIERPLKLSFTINSEGITKLENKKIFQNLKNEERNEILNILNSKLLQQKNWDDKDNFQKEIEIAFKDSSYILKSPMKKAFTSVFSEKNQTAKPSKDKNGSPESDTSLREYESIPFGVNWKNYFKEKVLPFVPEAWVDEDFVDKKDQKIGRIGYEINFNDYFYKFDPPRKIIEISTELKKIEKDISNLFNEVFK